MQPPHQPSFGSTMMLERACRTSPNFVAKLSSPLADVLRATEPLCECIVCEQAACLVPQANQFITQVELLHTGRAEDLPHTNEWAIPSTTAISSSISIWSSITILRRASSARAYKQTLEGAAISGRSRLLLEL